MALRFQLMRLMTVLLLGLGIATGPAVAAFAQPAPDLYQQHCAGCHGTTGNGDGSVGKLLKPPPQPFHTALRGKSDEWIAGVIKGGGASAGLPPAMPAFSSLSDPQINSLVQYLRKLGS
jgi:high-affinity iron transporter